MSMQEWAKREVEIASKRERGDNPDSEDWDYGVACYEGALEAFEVLCEQGHSGASICFTMKTSFIFCIKEKKLIALILTKTDIII